LQNNNIIFGVAKMGFTIGDDRRGRFLALFSPWRRRVS
jgi:hypothetical protein